MKRIFDKKTKFSIIGMAKSGIASANLLYSMGYDVLISDLKEKIVGANGRSPLHQGISIVTGRNEIRDGDVVIMSPGIHPESEIFKLAYKKGSAVISEIELFYLLCPAPIIAITGTDGKSTVTTFTGHILKNSGYRTFVGGNLGNPLTEMIPEITPDSVVVAEVSCFQLLTTKDFKPEIATITNIAEDHIDYHGSFENYISAKKLVYKNMGSGNSFVRNVDDPVVKNFKIPQRIKILDVSTKRPVEYGFFANDNTIYLNDSKKHEVAMISDLQIKGRHNIENAVVSAGCTYLFGVKPEIIGESLKSYKPLPHRMEHAGEIKGIMFVNDSKATNPHSAITDIASVESKIILIAGGFDKGLDLNDFAKIITDRVSCVILLGDKGASRLKPLIDGKIFNRSAKNMQSAIELSFEEARKLQCETKDKITVLLSPGFSSYDLYHGFEERGDDFKEKVINLKNKIIK